MASKVTPVATLVTRRSESNPADQDPALDLFPSPGVGQLGDL
jgi:hypothetical protein